MTRRLFSVLVCTSLLLGLVTPVAADEPVDPAGQPVESGAEDDAEVGVLADVPTGVHDKFAVGDVFVAVSGGKVQWPPRWHAQQDSRHRRRWLHHRDGVPAHRQASVRHLVRDESGL
jgi:hypothetical protein